MVDIGFRVPVPIKPFQDLVFMKQYRQGCSCRGMESFLLDMLLNPSYNSLAIPLLGVKFQGNTVQGLRVSHLQALEPQYRVRWVPQYLPQLL